MAASEDLLLLLYGKELGLDWALGDTLRVYDQARHSGLPYWDVRTAVRCLAHVLRPSTYLEIGVRRGWSLAQVFAERPDSFAYVCDAWIENYGGFEQGSPDYLRAKMREVTGAHYEPSIEFISGNSHDVLPAWFCGNYDTSPAPDTFDLITVDGDHTRVGAWWDLVDLLPRVAVGGALVFDDIDELGDGEATPQATSKVQRPELPHSVRTLMDLWLHVQSMHPNFVFWTCGTLKYRAGAAFRIG